MLHKAYNIRAYDDFLDAPEGLTNPVSSTTLSLPFPFLHLGTYWNLLFTATGLYLVDIDTWTLTSIDIYSYDTNAITAIPTGGQWHIVDLHTAIYAFNGECVIFCEGMESLNRGVFKWYINTDVTINTGVTARGRVITGGFDGDNVWKNWTSILDPMARPFESGRVTSNGEARVTSDGTARKVALWTNPTYVRRITSSGITRVTSDGVERAVSGSLSTGMTLPTNDIDSNYLLWGSIGGGDFPLWLMYPEARAFEYGPNAERLQWALQRNEFGWMPMPWAGTILKIVPHEKHLMVYGSGGTTLVTAHPSQTYADTPPTYGITKNWPARLACRSAVDGDERGHLMVAEDGYLWIFTPELTLQRLGYKEYFEDEASSAIVTLHEDSGDFYITMPSTSYLFSRGGLTQVMDKVTSIAQNYATKEDRLQQSLELITQEFDMEERSRKTVSGLALSFRGLATVRVALEYRFRPNEEFRRTPFNILSPEGYAFIRCEGTDFRVVVNANKRDAFYLDSIRVDYQLADKRYCRGPTANQVNR